MAIEVAEEGPDLVTPIDGWREELGPCHLTDGFAV
jgi:hypothetical protein